MPYNVHFHCAWMTDVELSELPLNTNYAKRFTVCAHFSKEESPKAL